MASSTGFTGPIQRRLFALTAANAALATADAIEAIAIAADRIPYVLTADDIGNESAPINFEHWGETSGRSIPGVPPISSWSFTVSLDASDAQHKKFLGTAASGSNWPVGTKLDIVLEVQTGSDNSTYTYIRGSVASRLQSKPDGAQDQMTIGIELEQDALVYDES